MNKIEKLVYDSVKSAPWIKNLIRNIYQTAFDLLPRQKEYSIATIDYREGYFYGFHDRTPFTKDNRKILANHFKIPLRMPQKGETLDVGFFNLENGKFGEFIKIGEAESWNYHKGCRLQWINENRLIFNSTIEGKLVSKIIEINSLKEQIINYPIDTVSNDGHWATSFSYERLQELMPGYGYDYADDGFLNENAPKLSGLFLVNLDTNSKRLLVSLHELASGLNNDLFFKNFRHYITHTEFSPDGRYISFLHRWTLKDIRDRTTRLVIYDLTENNYFVAPTDGMVSHYVWNSQNQIVAYCRVDDKDCHVLFHIPNISNYKKIAPLVLNSDGHQSFLTDTSFITDTYPDKFRMAKLYHIDIDKSEVQLLANLYSPKKFQTHDFKKHIACDLHPRVSPDGKYICFDSVRTGQRSLCIMALPAISK